MAPPVVTIESKDIQWVWYDRVEMRFRAVVLLL